ncbi:hypothetical protein EAE96_010810 [Botrytis aclada]|nr:hypothetical protein EAE96_010810 [Botrytis aclada]
MSQRLRSSRPSPVPSSAPRPSQLPPTSAPLQDLWEWDTDLSVEANNIKSMEFTTAHNMRWEDMQRWELPNNLTSESACNQYQAWVVKVRLDAGMKRGLAISFPKGVPPLRAYFHPVFFKRELGAPRMGDMISVSPEFDAEPIPSLTETTYNNIIMSLPKHAVLCSLKDYVAPSISKNIFDRVCHRHFPNLTIEELQGDLIPFDGHYDWMFRWPDIFSEKFLLQNTLWTRDFIISQQNYQVCWITRTVEMQRNLPHGNMLYCETKYYRENPHEVPENCRASVIAEARKRGKTPHGQYPYGESVYQPEDSAVASGSGTYSHAQIQSSNHDTGHADSGYYQPTTQAGGSRYPDNSTSSDEGSTSGYGAEHYGQSSNQPSGSGNTLYGRDQPSVYDPSGTGNYQANAYNQYTSQSGGSGHPGYPAGGQQYNRGDERANEPYGNVKTNVPNIIAVEPRHQERTPASRDNTASGSRSSKKEKIVAVASVIIFGQSL